MRARHARTRLGVHLVFSICLCFVAAPARSQCPPEPTFQNFTGAGQVVCPCFVPDEEAGAVFNLPPGDYPIEILKVGIGWGSQLGGQPDSLEQAIRIYAGALPDPGSPIFELPGPLLVDGAINEFDLEPFDGAIVVDSGPFTVTLQLFNQNSGNPFAPSVVHDGNGCQFGKNVVKAIPGGWNDACLLGVTGDWVFTVTYRKLDCGPGGGSGAVPDGDDVAGSQLTVAPFVNGLLQLAWGASCSANDNNYEVYEGSLGSFPEGLYSHSALLCTTAGATSTIFVPGPGDTYYLVVPRDDLVEGSYGRASSGSERPPGSTTCLPQQAATCP